MSLFPKFQVKSSPAAIPAIPAIRDGNVDRNSENSGNSNAPVLEQKNPFAPSLTPDPAGNIPYRLNVGNVTRLVWLPPGLEPAEVLQRAKALHPGVVVSDEPPPQGWPRLADIPEVPRTGAPQPVEAWTPSGKRLVVPAYSTEHAAAIHRMNPLPKDADEKPAFNRNH